MTRQEANRAIIRLLQWQVESYPDLRFGQILVNSNALELEVNKDGSVYAIDPFNEEPEDMLNRMMGK